MDEEITEVLRIRILEAIKAALAEMTEAGGYIFDIPASSVFIGRSVYGDNDPLPMLCILEVPIPLDQIASPLDSAYSAGTWELLIQGFVEDDKTEPTHPAHRLMAGVKKRLAVERKQLALYNAFGMGKAIYAMRIGAGVVRPPDEVSAKAYFWLNVALDIAEDLENPFEDTRQS